MIRHSSLKRSQRPIKKKPRSKAERLRIYGPPGRVEFVKSLPCAACGVVGYSENAHVPPKGEAGTGYKADYRFIVPLCGPRPWNAAGQMFIGCHEQYDDVQWAFDMEHPDFDAEKACAQTETLWLQHTESR